MPTAHATYRSPALVLLAAALALGVAACGNGPSSEAQEAVTVTEGATTVVVDDNVFRPADLTVPAGAEVTWSWEGSSPHNVVGEGFESAVQRHGTFTHRFDDPGTHSYECTLHSGMTGTVTVTP